MVCVVTPIINTLKDFGDGQRERRRVVRRPLDLRVDISVNDGISSSFTGINIGMGGVFIRVDSSLFHPGDIIKPRFFLNYGGLYKPCGVVVQVIHVNTDGVGVCFHQHDGSLFRCIYKTMYEARHKKLDSAPASISDKYRNTGLPQVVSLNVVSRMSKYQWCRL